MARPGFMGSGPGAQTQDGCSVEVYKRSSYRGEFEAFRERLAPGTRVLELGCGTGRLTRALLSLGCVVTAVDNSAEMLAALPAEASPVLSSIEALALAPDFDVVLLASGLINHGDAAVRAAFVQAAARHLKADGQFILERQDAAWLAAAAVGPVGQLGELGLWVEALERQGEQVSMRLRYEAGAECWHQSFTIQPLSDPALQALLAAGGFAAPQWLDPPLRRWASASPGPAASSI